MLLNKNPDKSQNWMLVVNELIEKNILSSILCLQPFTKTKFLAELIDRSNNPTIYIDFDLMFSGYVDGGFLSIRKNVVIIRPTKKNWKKTLQMILIKISEEKFSVIIDSLNGFYSMFDEKDAGRLINAYIMLLAYVAKQTQSSIMFVSIAQKKDPEGWVLNPTGRHVINSKKITKFFLKQNDSFLTLNVLNEDDSTKNSIQII